MIVAMDLVEWVEEAESLLRSDGLWPEQDEERARGHLTLPARRAASLSFGEGRSRLGGRT
jgi:hypothetical protein